VIGGDVKILVTGGSGFIGSYVVDLLKNMGLIPVVFDRKGRPREDGVEVHLGDTRDLTSVMESVGSTEGVIHLAGVLGTQETINEPEPAVQTNIHGGLNVFKAVRHYKVPAVYIAVGNHWMNNSYSITKTTAERFALMFNAEHGTHIAVVRALNAYGPRQKAAPVRKIMPNLINPILDGKPIQIYGDGEQIMDMIYVQDVASILVDALLLDHGVYDRVFEAGTGRRTTVNEIAQLVVKELQADGDPADLIEHLPMRPGEPERSVVMGDPKTLAPLGIMPEDLTTLEAGVQQTCRWYHEQAEIQRYLEP
jgi:nucleoside-diphosphate-sugar epimerase